MPVNIRAKKITFAEIAESALAWSRANKRDFAHDEYRMPVLIGQFGKRRADVREREAQLAQATENLTRLKEQVAVGIRKSYSKVERTKHLVQVANEIVKLRQESGRLAENQLTVGVVLVSESRQATAAMQKAQADFLQASLGHLLALAELEQAVGHTPGL